MSSVTDKKEFHVFISYRVAADADLAEKICDKLQQHSVGADQNCRFKCFLDKHRLVGGENWKDQFLSALERSCLFLPLISASSLRPLRRGRDTNPSDNFLLEMETALKLRGEKRVVVYPLLVGECVEGGGYRRFDEWNDYEDRPISEGRVSPAETLRQIFDIQGTFCNPKEIADKIPTLLSVFNERVWPQYRHLWRDADTLGPEKVNVCVQCMSDYLESQNGDGSCAYHSETRDGKFYRCCSDAQVKGCMRSRHRGEHHNDYPYEQKTNLWSRIVYHLDQREAFFELQAENLSGADMSILIGKVTGKGQFEKRLLVCVGWAREYFDLWDFQHFTVERSRVLSGDDPTFCTVTRQDKSMATLRWSVTDNYIDGIDIECVTSTTVRPYIAKVKFTWQSKDEPPVLQEAILIQDGSFCEKPLSRSYSIPKSLHFDGSLIREPLPFEDKKPPQDLFAVVTPPGWIKVKTSDHILVNQQYSYRNKDVFLWPITVINLSSDPIILSDCEASWARLGEDFQGVTSCEINGVSAAKTKTKFPVTIAPKSSVTLEAEISIEDPAKENAGHGWWYCSWNARSSPLILKVSVTDVEERKFEIGQQFSNRRIQLDRSAPKESFFWFFYDNSKSFERIAFTITKESQDDPTKGYSGRYPGRGLVLDRKTLRKYACDAIGKGEDIVEIPLESEVFRLYAAIDRNARRVYAFRLEANYENFKAFGVCPLEDYGDKNEGSEGTVEPCPPHASLNPPSNWTYFDLTKEIPYLEIPSVDLAKYFPSPPQVFSSNSAGSSGPVSFGVTPADIQNLILAQNDMKDLLMAVNDKIDDVLSRMSKLEMKMSSLERNIQMKK